MATSARIEAAFDAATGLPKHLVYDGLQYTKSNYNPEGITGRLVVLVAVADDEDEDEDVRGAGPYHVVFNRWVYHKSSTDPADIGDEVLRTKEAIPLHHANPPQQAQQPAILNAAPHILQPLQVPPPVHYSAPLQPAPAPPPAAVPPAGNQPPVHVQQPAGPFAPLNGHRIPGIGFPPRAAIPNPNNLQGLFDVLPHQRGNFNYIPAGPYNNYVGTLRGNTAAPPGSRQTFHHVEVTYLSQLLEIAMRLLGRRLRPVDDFPAIAEALNRRFHGTNYGPRLYVHRGYNTVHSFVIKSLVINHNALVNHLGLP
ncbi:uncharacterized protein LY89DRAFT_739496 [Mollisia scopiformis]|uniref:Uncharacterized protein n=1 Tax=Mollisia scopiformis TaxID=149040 RepID=A0A194WTM0_MOLSC|nr:uncharacterized protein LY89DRAFT_739496 [Mollisia scopiformis]KUJ11300.1 hypothetical protein LY89DRAFT_739496 [Mollisia scopiformis]